MSQTRALVDQLLTNVSVQLRPDGMISELVLPKIYAKQSSGKLAKYGNKHLQIVNSTTGGRGAYRRVETRVMSTTNYLIEGHGLEGIVTKDDYRNVQLPFKAEEDETYATSTILLVDKEVSLATTLGDTSIMTQNTTLVGTAQLSDYTNSDPIGVANTAREAVRAGSGMPPNTLIMDWAVANRLRYHPKILSTLGFQYNRAGSLTDSDLQRAFNVEKIFITAGVYNTAHEGQTDSVSAIWGKNMVFAYIPDQAQPNQVSLGYYVVYEGESPRKVYKYAINNPPESTGILVEDNYAMLISNPAAGYLIKNAIA